MESESGSRSSQESSLVGAFRPVPSCKPQHSSRHTICTSIPSRQSRQPRTQGCTSVYPWDSSSWSDWLQSCNEHSDPSVGNRTTNRMQCSHSGHQKCCHTDQGSSQNQTAHRCNSGSEFIRHNGMMPGQSTWETGKGRSPFVTGCPFDALPDMPIMAPIRQSRSVESLLELQVHRASSSISMVSVRGVDVESSVYGAHISKVPLADRENLISLDLSLHSLDASMEEEPLHAYSSDGIHRTRQQGVTEQSKDNKMLPATRPALRRRVEMTNGPEPIGTYTDTQSRQLPIPTHSQRTGREYRPEARLLAPRSTDLIPDSSGAHTESFDHLHLGSRSRQGNNATLPQRPPFEIKKKERQLNRWHKILNTTSSWWDRAGGVRLGAVKRLIRKGIPDELRGQAWMALSGGSELRNANPGVFSLLLTQPCDADHLIRRDLHRTFPNHTYFQEEGGPGQQALFNVLRAYAIHDPEVCYVQGMGTIVAVLLLYMREEDAFWTFTALMKPPISGDDQKRFRRGMRSLYVNGLPLCRKLNMQFEHILGKKFNRLSDSLATEGYEPTMYATKWWMTLFTFSLPFSHVVRVWDIFMLEGWKMGVRVGLAIMKTLEKHLVGHPFDTLIERMAPEYLGAVISSTNDFIKAALKIRVSRSLNQWEKKHSIK